MTTSFGAVNTLQGQRETQKLFLTGFSSVWQRKCSCHDIAFGWKQQRFYTASKTTLFYLCSSFTLLSITAPNNKIYITWACLHWHGQQEKKWKPHTVANVLLIKLKRHFESRSNCSSTISLKFPYQLLLLSRTIQLSASRPMQNFKRNRGFSSLYFALNCNIFSIQISFDQRMLIISCSLTSCGTTHSSLPPPCWR